MYIHAHVDAPYIASCHAFVTILSQLWVIRSSPAQPRSHWSQLVNSSFLSLLLVQCQWCTLAPWPSMLSCTLSFLCPMESQRQTQNWPPIYQIASASSIKCTHYIACRENRLCLQIITRCTCIMCTAMIVQNQT